MYRRPRLLNCLRFAVLSAPVVLVAACGGSDTAPSSRNASHYLDVRVGSGAAVVQGDLVAFNYGMWDYDRTKPDWKGHTQFDFVLINGSPASRLVQLSDSLTQTVIGMKPGGLRRVIVPSEQHIEGFVPKSAPATKMVLEIDFYGFGIDGWCDAPDFFTAGCNHTNRWPFESLWPFQ